VTKQRTTPAAIAPTRGVQRIIATANLKGGCGKTSLAVNLAAALQGPRRRVAVIDADPQRSATRWAEWGAELPFRVYPLDASKGAARFQTALEAIDGDLLVIDTPPELEAASMMAAQLADLLLIPCSPGALDLWATEAAVRMAREARIERLRIVVSHYGRSLREISAERLERDGRVPLVSLVPSRVISRTNLAKQLPETLAAIGEPVAPPITQRVAIAQATIEGGTVRPSSPAGQEFAALARHVLNRLRSI
jgi:chromosome partitioning protein